jgi:hypothetical protein
MCTAETPQHTRAPFPRIWAYLRGRYWSAKIDDISVHPLVLSLYEKLYFAGRGLWCPPRRWKAAAFSCPGLSSPWPQFGGIFSPPSPPPVLLNLPHKISEIGSVATNPFPGLVGRKRTSSEEVSSVGGGGGEVGILGL